MKNIRLIALDVDGTLTDGKIYYDRLGNEIKAFNVKDGMGITQAIKNGIEVAIITGRKSEIVEKRGQELGIKYIYQGINCKKDVLDIIIEKVNVNYKEVMYIGDDINDLDILREVGYAACPNDAVYEVKSICKFISNQNGGDGAVRQIIENVLKDQEKWVNIINNYVGTNQ